LSVVVRTASGVATGWDALIRSRGMVLDRAVARHRQIPETRPGLDEVLSALPTGSALVAYVRYERLPAGRREPTGPAYPAIVAAPGMASPVAVPLGDAGVVEDRIREWRERVAVNPGLRAPGGSPGGYVATGRALREAIWDPVARSLGGATLVFVVPDGA